MVQLTKSPLIVQMFATKTAERLTGTSCKPLQGFFPESGGRDKEEKDGKSVSERRSCMKLETPI